MTNIYIAGKWSQKEEIRKIMSEITSLGYKITHDWTYNETLTNSSKEMEKYAELDINGVKNADIVLAIMTDVEYAYRGTFTELGCAIGLNKDIFIYCPQHNSEDKSYCKTNCFYHHSSISHFSNWNDVIDNLKNYLCIQ